MPRKIPDLEKKIIEAAGDLFLRDGFAAVDMKTIAVHAGTSVGNLYNYYASKTQLFMDVSKGWVEALTFKFVQEQPQYLAPAEKLRLLMDGLYDGLKGKFGLWDEFIDLAIRPLPENERSACIHMIREGSRGLFVIIADIVRSQSQNEQSRELVDTWGERLSGGIAATIKLLLRRFPNEDEINKEFLYHYVAFVCGISIRRSE